MKVNQTILNNALVNIKKLIPKQGPIDKFIPNNTLQEFENMDFHDALCYVQKIKGSQTYMEHATYLNAWQVGRISDVALSRAFEEEKSNFFIQMNSEIKGLNEFSIFKNILKIPHNSVTDDSISWNIQYSLPSRCPDQWLDDTDHNLSQSSTSLEKKSELLLRLWEKINTSSRDWKEPSVKATSYIWDLQCLKKANKVTCDFLASFFDEGISYFPMHRSPRGLLSTFISFQLNQDLVLPNHLRLFQNSLRDFPEDGPTSTKISYLIQRFNLSDSNLESFLYACLKDIQGWAGLICHFENQVNQPSFVDLVILRLFIFCTLGLDKNLQVTVNKITSPRRSRLYECLIFLIQSELPIDVLLKLPKKAIIETLITLTDFSLNLRLKCLHKAYEYEYYSKIANSLINKELNIANKDTKTTFRAVFCIDDREESIRRHLEEVDPLCETFGFAGFFNMDILFKRQGKKNLESLCPIVIKPTKIIEESEGEHSFKHRFLSKNIFFLRRFIFQKSRTFFVGTLLHFSLLLFTLCGDFIRFLSPKLFSVLVKNCRKWIDPSHGTKINIDQHVNSAKNSFSFEDFANKVEAMLRTIGLTENFTELTFIVSHGSTNVNNPHYSVYDCGACSGQKGSPNARVFCGAINHPSVRNLLRTKGIDIPSRCWFIPAYHDTCSDELSLFELTQLPLPIQAKVAQIEKVFLQACRHNAQERVRRFDNVPFVNPFKAYSIAQARSLKYAQPRPEYDHATNALCFVGKREMTKGIFLDRRAFLCSYDSSSDENGSILVALLSAIVPVCAGINLLYLFSRIDNEVFGAGSKLPHNVTSMLGVVNGAGGDLRTGLHWQTVEIHEPIRLLMIIEINLKKMLSLESELPNLFRLAKNQWIKLAIFDRESNSISYLDGSQVSITKSMTPNASSSQNCFFGKRHLIDPCYIGGKA